MSAVKIVLTSFADQPIKALAQHIIELAQSQSALPLLTNTIVFTPQSNVAAELRYQLLVHAQKESQQALLGPKILPLQQWLQTYQPNQLQVVNETTQELILVEALQQHKGMFDTVNPWIYAHSLLELFQSLTANKIDLPKNEEDFIKKLYLAYGITSTESTDESDINIDALSQEAHFVFTLWNAWHQQLNAYNVVDNKTALLLSMQCAIDTLNLESKINFYFLDYDRLTKTETQWIEKLAEQHNVYYFLQGQNSEDNNLRYHPDKHITNCINQFSNKQVQEIENSNITTDKLHFINQAYAIQPEPLKLRAAQYDLKEQSPLANLHCYAANDNEQEARAIDIQIRRWLLEGKTKLAIVTENRRLARRVRALLERSGVHLQDAAGWALSTTRAAATVERWLECIENDFNYLSLLDLLKSSFIFPDINPHDLQYAIYRFEQDIIRHENISQQLKNYQQGIKSRANRLPDWFEETHTILNNILSRLSQAAAPLHNLLQSEEFSPQVFINTMTESLSALGLTETLAADAAGVKIINLFDDLAIESNIINLKFNWNDARAWLAMQLERSRFMPPSSETQIQLIGLSQSTQQNFDGLIIAAVEDEFLPGSPTPSAFFNDAVKYELGLETSLEDKNERFYHFIRLLNASEHTLLSYRSQNETGEPIQPSAWLSLLEHFHQLVFNTRLEDSQLIKLVNSPENTFTHQAEKLANAVLQPIPVIPENIIPTKISASQYQSLMNCPYLFYAARCLKLEATDEIRQALSKADYGQRIHQALEAFHFDIAELPGPFKATLNKQNKNAAEKILSAIIKDIFSADIIGNHEHQAWYTQATKMIPHYIDWQIKHGQHWSTYKAEEKASVDLKINNTDNILTLTGRLDRIDKNLDDSSNLAIIDYKTGQVSTDKAVIAGEQVQLPFYQALLQNENVQQVEYLEIKDDIVKSKAKLTDDDLKAIAEESTERLKEIFSQLHSNTGLPAWGDEKTCKRCDMQGICRKQMWQDLV